MGLSCRLEPPMLRHLKSQVFTDTSHGRKPLVSTESPGSLLNNNKFTALKFFNVYDTYVCYLLHLSMAVLCLIDFCILHCTCSNARVRYEVTCRYSYVGYQHKTGIKDTIDFRGVMAPVYQGGQGPEISEK